MRLNRGCVDGPVVSVGTWHAAQPTEANMVSPARTVSLAIPRGGGPRNFMKASKLSIAESRVRGSGRSSGSGVGSQSHLAGALLMTMANFESLHVPHKGGGPSVASVAGGQTHWTLTPAPAAMSQVKAGRLRVIAHSLPRRSALLAEIPPIAETVAGYDFNGWAGLLAPKGTPKPIIDRVHAAMIKTLAVSEVKDGLAGQGADLFPGNAQDFRKFLAQDVANTERVMKAAQLQPE